MVHQASKLGTAVVVPDGAGSGPRPLGCLARFLHMNGRVAPVAVCAETRRGMTIQRIASSVPDRGEDRWTSRRNRDLGHKSNWVIQIHNRRIILEDNYDGRTKSTKS